MKYWLLIAIFFSVGTANASSVELLNVSYDPTREFYEEYNTLFTKYWEEKTGQNVAISQSHGGSGKQARAVIDGLKADVVTLALAYDIDEIAERSKLIPSDWQTKFAHNSAPYTSTILFVVRDGNPKNIKDWDDLIRDDVKVITPNPKTSGGARWNYLAAWAYAQKKFAGDGAKTTQFISKLYKNVPILDTGARGATTTFTRRGMGDVLICWENEAHLAVKEMEKSAPGQKISIIVPSLSILAEPPVAVLEENTNRKGTTEAAKEYLGYLYSGPAQELAVKYHLRPTDETIAAKYADQFPAIKMVTIAELGGWKAMQKNHFDDGGVFDQIYLKK